MDQTSKEEVNLTNVHCANVTSL